MKVKPRQRGSRLATGLGTAGVIIAAIVWLGTVTTSEAAPEIATAPVGLWYAEGGAAQVQITHCGSELCGSVAWLRSPFDENGCPLRDRFNPEESLRHRSVVGLEILRGLEVAQGEGQTWKGGTIYDPGSGDTYRASLTVIDENRIELRGYIGIPLIGRTTHWFRVGAERDVCRNMD